MVQPHDEPLLKQLTDIKIKYDEDLSYTLEFFFAPNDYFTDSVLSKKYFLRCKIDGEEPFSFEGPEIFKCSGCNINWKPGKNITVKTIKKKQKHKARGAVRTVSKQVPNDSFFNFFNPPDVPEDESKLDEESQNILATDFEIGHFLRARIIPRAVLFYTGDLIDDDDSGEWDNSELRNLESSKFNFYKFQMKTSKKKKSKKNLKRRKKHQNQHTKVPKRLKDQLDQREKVPLKEIPPNVNNNRRRIDDNPSQHSTRNFLFELIFFLFPFFSSLNKFFCISSTSPVLRRISIIF